MVASATAVLKRLKTEWATHSQREAIIAACLHRQPPLRRAVPLPEGGLCCS
jgi:hypothetical protein